jgi:hypothetical protein
MNIKQQFDEMRNKGIEPLFEMPVIDKRTGEQDFILFIVSIRNRQLVAVHVALNSEEENSEKIAYKAVDIDEDFDLDHHLNQLYILAENALFESEFFKYFIEN